ncbi:DNA-binding response regulator [Sphingorhabdus pulchriflava]|jgi:two-component system, NarL family, nitrate/nitrite response regulator NarL|uniref:DNA-binding response regulator n=1 Tax=Sphingorhabdus pulchriflava TaxID=2292257 RepID=A0A371B2K7_9SPHN|nr:response regulator transcription factor [Sphingorhabdus pulchriflava]RDV01691.1 DNA-binding response regulator [Sphingorhabdus pulchriflava]
MHNVLIVDDHPFFLHGFSQYVEESGEYSITTALSVEEAIEKIDVERPDIAMLDVTMHNGGGLKVLRHLRQHYPMVPAMFLTVHIDPDQTIEAMRLGIKGIALKDSDPDTIVEAMGVVLGGGKWFESDVTEVALRHSIDRPTRTVRSDDLLTKRELEIVDLVCMGLRNRDIAQRCNLAEGTVKIHLNSIFRKLGVASRSELIVHRGGMRQTGDNSGKAH